MFTKTMDLETFFAGVQAVLDRSTAGAAELAGVPGRNLIGVVDNVVTLIDTVFSGLMDSTSNQTIVASLTILKTLSVDAFGILGRYSFVLPALVFLIVFMFYPLVYTFNLSLFDVNAGNFLRGGAAFVGFENYIEFVTSRTH